ncbi:hypothetical protein H0H92_008988 [Tricholoma furcatifolium]|nr:hypothetical protein H0H92_008988 [Tricholoma furcatifolium]
MPSVTAGDITLHFTDSGPPLKEGDSLYMTIIFFHGHTFHSGIFQHLATLAGTRALRIIAFNRRQYPGSTPYNEAEQRVILSGSLEERTAFMKEEGNLGALAIDRIIQDLNLPQQVAIAGWSLGVVFAISMYGAITRVPTDVAARLKTYVKSFILLEPTAWPLGIPEPTDAYLPLWDKSLQVEDRIPAFGQWYFAYFNHGDLSSRDAGQLQRHPQDVSKSNRIDVMPRFDLLSTTDLATELRFDTVFIEESFSPILAAQTDIFLTDLMVHEAWRSPKVLCLYGEATFWCTIYAIWYLEEKGETLQHLDLRFKSIKDANHFFVWDLAEETLDRLKEFTNL